MNTDTTHHDECWRDHAECAQQRIVDLTAERDELRALVDELASCVPGTDRGTQALDRYDAWKAGRNDG